MLSRFHAVFVSLTILFAFGAYFFFSLQGLSQFETADEHYWIYDPQPGRIAQYWQALREGDLEKTYINDKPGVTLALVSGAAYLLGADTDNADHSLFEEYGYYRIYHPEEFSDTFFLFRIPLVVFNAVICLLAFFLLLRLSHNVWVSLWAFLFMLLSPILLGMSRIVNPDALLWSLVTLTALAFAAFLWEGKKRYGVLATVSFGLSLLTKYAATLLHPFLFFLLLVFLAARASSQDVLFSRTVARAVYGYWAVTAGAFLVFALGMPAAFLSLEIFRKGVFGFWGMEWLVLSIFIGTLLLLADAFLAKGRVSHFLFSLLIRGRQIIEASLSILFVVAVVAVLLNWLDLYVFQDTIRQIPLDIERGVAFKKRLFWEKTLLELVPLVFTLTPLALVSVMAAWLRSFVSDRLSVITFVLSSFIALFLASVLSISLLAGVRYSIIVYPAFAILGGIGLYGVFSLPYLRRVPKGLVTLGLLVASVVSLFAVAPYYFQYTAEYFPPTRIVNDAWGAGGAAAAEYLNALPDAERLTVWTDYNGFCSFFKGKCIKGSRDWKQHMKTSGQSPDYFVKTRRGSTLYQGVWKDIHKLGFLSPYQDPVWSMHLARFPKNYVALYERLGDTSPAPENPVDSEEEIIDQSSENGTGATGTEETGE